jgi:hypothetical protein
MIDAFVERHRHFIDHLAPIWNALPADRRGSFYVPESLREWADQRGIAVTVFSSPKDVIRELRRTDDLLIVNSYSDLGYALKSRRPAVLVDHGNGQSFSNTSPHHPGGIGRNRDSVVLYIMPNTHAAMRNQESYPDVPNAVVGCAKLDHWHIQSPKTRSTPPVVCLSWHWDCRAESPEKRWAWDHFESALPELVRAAERGEFQLIGHGHPRAWQVLERAYQRLGIESVKDLEEVFARADVYVNDSSSTLYEFASLDRPVVVLNAPWFRRDVNHGIRFWDAADVGVQVDSPELLLSAIRRALIDSPEQQRRRREAVTHAYTFTDGCAAERASVAIQERHDALRTTPYTPPRKKGPSMHIRVTNRQRYPIGRRGYTFPPEETVELTDVHPSAYREIKASRYLDVEVASDDPPASAPPAPAPAEESPEESDVDIGTLNVAELRSMAASLGIETPMNTRKADLVAILIEARAAGNG